MIDRKMIKLKVCGMRDPANILAVAGLRPDYMGFIFYRGSKRFVGVNFRFPSGMSPTIKKVGVFVNQVTQEIVARAGRYKLDFVQLHGGESKEQCRELRHAGLRLIKAFSIHSDFDFEQMKPYKNVVDYFLFDTAGKNFGGSGIAFDWRVLKNYDQQVPFFLSGGISPNQVKKLDILEGMNLHALDVNSGVEREPGIKDVELIKELNIKSL